MNLVPWPDRWDEDPLPTPSTPIVRRCRTRIRRATLEADGLDVVLMVQRFLEGTAYGGILAFDPEAVAELVERTIEHGVIFVGQVEGGTIAAGGEWQTVGMIAALVGRHHVSRQILSEEMAWWVNPEQRKTTLGPKLLRCLEDWARQNGALMLKMVAPAESDVGAFYTRLGYTPLETAYIKRL